MQRLLPAGTTQGSSGENSAVRALNLQRAAHCHMRYPGAFGTGAAPRAAPGACAAGTGDAHTGGSRGGALRQGFLPLSPPLAQQNEGLPRPRSSTPGMAQQSLSWGDVSDQFVHCRHRPSSSPTPTAIHVACTMSACSAGLFMCFGTRLQRLTAV